MKLSTQTVKADAEEWRRLPSPGVGIDIIETRPMKETGSVPPFDLVQNTYARLNDVYAQNLYQNWAEEAEPAKHVFEDLAIAAFIIELWRTLYGISPKSEALNTGSTVEFPGFVDMACGNGVLVYVLLMEGYQGQGFDVRRRNSWKIFPDFVRDQLREKVFIPKPFIDVLEPGGISLNVEMGTYSEGTFLIANHADELTVWTPLMAALACPESPLPFLAIPCCSHSLSGDRYRYAPPKTRNHLQGSGRNEDGRQGESSIDQDGQPGSGDLKALRLLKQKEKTEEGMFTSMYGSLTAKTLEIAEEIGYHVDRTKLQIPSPRNMGIIGSQPKTTTLKSSGAAQNIMKIIQRECEKDGGVHIAAKKWVERAQSVHRGTSEGNTIH